MMQYMYDVPHPVSTLILFFASYSAVHINIRTYQYVLRSLAYQSRWLMRIYLRSSLRDPQRLGRAC